MAEGALLPPVIVRLMGDMTQLRGTLRTARSEMNGTAGSFRQAGATAFAGVAKMGRSVTLVGAGVAVASVKMASDFQTQMTRLQTAAGLGDDKIKALGLTSDTLNAKVLKIGSSVGVTGTKMAEALYHPISAGLDLKSALNVVTEAAKESKISGASLEDTTYSLSSVMKAFNEPASATKQTMASLNAIVGQGDMRFQDFNESVKNWAPTASQMGISINSMGAGLAYLTDRGNSAEVASTRLTMGISMMTTPSKQATKLLEGMGLASSKVSASSKAMKTAMEKTGITQNRLAADLKKPDGLYVALKDLKDGLKKAGVSGTEADSVLSKIFGGGRSDKAVMSLMQNLDGVKEKFGDIEKASKPKNFDAAWAKTQKSFAQQMTKMKVSVENLGIAIGLKLIPVIQKTIDFFSRHKTAAVALAGVIGGVLALSVAAYAAKLVMSAGKVVLGFGKMGVGAVKGATNIVRGFRDANRAASEATGKAGTFGGALRKGFDGAVKAAKTAGSAVGDFAKSVGKVSTAAGKTAWAGLVKGIKGVGGAMKTAALNAAGLVRSMAAATLAAARSAIAWTAEKLALVGAAIAEKAAAIGQWALNVAMDANPIMIVVLAVVALVGAVIYAYNHFAWFRNGVKAAWSAIVGAAKAAWDWLKRAFASIVDGLVWAYHGMVNTGKSVFNWVKALPGRIINYLAGLGAKLASQAIKAWSSFKSSVVSKASEAISWVKGLPGKVKGALGDLGSLLLSAGRSLISGFISGIKAKAGEAYNAVSGVVSKVRNLLPFSPAKEGPFSGRGWTLYSGHALMEGLAQGITAGAPRAVSTMKGAAQATADAFANTLGISSPSKVFRSLGIYVNEGLVDGLTASTARVKAATRRIETLLIQTYNKVADLKGSKGVSNKWVKSHEATIKHLEAYAKREDKALRSLAAKRDSVATKLKAAQKNLAALQKSWSDEVKSVAQGVMQGFSIVTEAPQEGFALSAADVVNKMRDQMARATQFAAQLRALQKKGLSSDLVAQIAAAGVDQGGATATALAGASKGQIAEINKLQTATQGAANSAGRAVADSMYGAGIKSAQGLVKGLQSQQKAIEKQMMKIATAMQKAIKHALGIKSPSTVFAAIGQWIPRGLAAGVEGGAHHATGAVHRLATSMAGAGSFAGSGLALAGGGGGGGGQTVVNQHFEFTIEGNVATVDKLAKDIEAAFLRRGARNPLTYQQYRR
ncbi:phage tail tape measure protein [Streptomyces sp. RLB1-33]|nr:phage tail tape measure protein [Streptomyces sp. RLB1-33]QIY72050.1 phage tail tape measure protein [Streptomyces sp. RLB1-33]